MYTHTHTQTHVKVNLYQIAIHKIEDWNRTCRFFDPIVPHRALCYTLALIIHDFMAANSRSWHYGEALRHNAGTVLLAILYFIVSSRLYPFLPLRTFSNVSSVNRKTHGYSSKSWDLKVPRHLPRRLTITPLLITIVIVIVISRRFYHRRYYYIIFISNFSSSFIINNFR